jgi:hypothetical protein
VVTRASASDVAEGEQMSQEQHDREVMANRFVRQLGVLRGLAPGAIRFGLSGFKDAQGAALVNAIFDAFFAKGITKATGLADKFLQVPSGLAPPPPASLFFRAQVTYTPGVLHL